MNKVMEIMGRNNWFKIRTKIRSYTHQLYYQNPADPYKCINITPSNGEYFVKNISRYDGLGQICEEDWVCIPLDENWVVKGLKQRYIEGYDWEDTIYYKKAEEEFNSGSKKWGYNSIKQFKSERCEYVDKLYESIVQKGYRPNKQGSHDVPEIDERQNEKKIVNSLEPLVAIDHDGSIYWKDGIHRLTIASISNIETVPVNVLARHEEWQELRDSINEDNEIPRQIKEHPDLIDL